MNGMVWLSTVRFSRHAARCKVSVERTPHATVCNYYRVHRSTLPVPRARHVTLQPRRPTTLSGFCADQRHVPGEVPAVAITPIQVKCAAGLPMWIDNQVKPCDIETRLERDMTFSRHRSLRSQTMTGKHSLFPTWDVLMTNGLQIFGAQPRKVTKVIPPLSLLVLSYA